MSLKIAVQMDPIERINIKGDSTFALLLEAQKRGLLKLESDKNAGGYFLHSDE